MDGQQLKGDLDLLRHATGATENTRRKNWGYRNYFAASADGDHFESLERMVAAGYAIKRQAPGDASMVYFHVTPLGCEVIGMTRKEIAKACPSRPASSGARRSE